MPESQRRLFVGNISFKAGETDLLTAFREAQIEIEKAEIVRDRTTGASRGFGFVELSPTEDPEVVVRTMQGLECLGRSMNLDIAQPRNGMPRRER